MIHKYLSQSGMILLLILSLAACKSASNETDNTTHTTPPLEQELTTVPYEFIRNVAYVADGTSSQMLDIYLPESEGEAGLCLFVVENNLMSALARYFARQGQHVIVVRTRRTNFHQSIQDAFCALAWVHANAQNYNINSGQLVVVGVGRRGGEAALLGVIDDPGAYLVGYPNTLPQSDHLKAAVIFSGLFDYSQDRDLYAGLSAYMGGSPDQVPETWLEASAITWIDGSEPPFLLLHALSDSYVNPHQSEIFEAALKQAGVEVELVLFSDQDHVGLQSSQQVFSIIDTFLDTFVRKPH